MAQAITQQLSSPAPRHTGRADQGHTSATHITRSPKLVMHCALKCSTHSGFTRPCRIGHQHTTQVFYNPESLRDALVLAVPLALLGVVAQLPAPVLDGQAPSLLLVEMMPGLDEVRDEVAAAWRDAAGARRGVAPARARQP